MYIVYDIHIYSMFHFIYKYKKKHTPSAKVRYVYMFIMQIFKWSTLSTYLAL